MKNNTNAWEEIKKFFQEKEISLNGNNFAGKNCKFSSLLESNDKIDSSKFSDEKIEVLKAIEELTQKKYNEAENYTATPISIKEVEGVKIVEFDRNNYCHVAQPNMDTIESIAKAGFLATEWFGQPESQGEAPYCTFLRSARFINSETMVTAGNNKVTFFIDTQNNAMQNMLTHDFFTYYYLIRHAHNQDEIDKIKLHFGNLATIYDYLIENEPTYDILSIAMNYYKRESMMDYRPEKKAILYDSRYWHAILSGIPPQYINGIKIKSSNNELNNHIEYIRELFPNAVIFNEYNMVIEHSNQQFTEEEIEIAKREQARAIAQEDAKDKKYASSKNTSKSKTI